jgi:hypothetical protein
MNPNSEARALRPEESSAQSGRWADDAVLLGTAAAVMLLHLLTNNRYGFHRDELQFLSDARHMDWGFVAYPPLTPFLEHILLSLFGLSMVGLRLFAVLAQATAILLTGWMARELGAGRWAQVTAALITAFAPVSLFEGTEFQYTAFDYLWWILIAYFTVRLLRSGDARWWLAIGAAVGLGLLTKYSIVFYIAGILAGVALTDARRFLSSKWFWGGIALALAMFAPNFIWLVRHDFISYHFLQHIHARDVGIGRATGFWKDQALLCVNAAAIPLCLAGLVSFLRDRRYRMLAVMYLVPVLLFFFGKGRGYYTAGAYPMLAAMGAFVSTRWLSSLPAIGRRALQTIYFTAFASVSVYICAVVLPVASSGPLRQFALSRNGDLREEFGWNDLVKTVAGIRDALPPQQRANFGITTGNYGEYGAIEMLGPAYGLPRPIGTTNSEWLRGYPTPAPTTFIVIGLREAQANSIFTGCRWAGHNGNAQGVKNEESEHHPDIFVCGPPREPWPEVWKEHQDFG